ncbi:MAG: CARDB domain-containing protein [Armatimonadota bacterium]
MAVSRSLFVPSVLLLAGLLSLNASGSTPVRAAATAPAFRLTDLSKTSGAAGVAMGISPAGQVTGLILVGRQQQLFHWRDGVQTGLGTLRGAYGYGMDVNDAGSVVGYVEDDEGYQTAVIARAGTLSALELPEAVSSTAVGVNAQGAIAGRLDTNTGSWGYLKSEAGVELLPQDTDPQALNDRSEIVGELYTGRTTEPFLWRDGVLTRLGRLGGAEASAYGVSSTGLVAGVSDTSAADAEGDPVRHGFLWDGALRDLGTLGGPLLNSLAADVNAAGLVVGRSAVNSGAERAVLWRRGRIFDLNSLVSASSWTLVAAYGINDGGSIVGGGLLNGSWRPILLTPVSADLSVTGSATPAAIEIGETATYRFTVRNAGGDTAPQVLFRVPAAAGGTIVSTSASQGTSAVGADGVACELGDLAKNASATVTVVVRGSSAGALTLNAAVESLGRDPQPQDNTLAVATGVRAPRADLEVTQSATPDPAATGENVTYTLTVKNHGPHPATAVTLVHQLPSAAVFVRAEPAQASRSGDRLTFALGSLASGASGSVRVTVLTDGTGALVSGASVSAAETDEAPENNSSELRTSVRGPEADLGVTVQASTATPALDDRVTLTYRITNYGPNPAVAVELRQPVPSALSVVSATASQGTASILGGELVAVLGSLAPGASAQVIVTADVRAPGVVTVSASVDGVVSDGNAANDSAGVELQVAAPVTDLALAILNEAARVSTQSGSLLRLTVRNQGARRAVEPVLRLTLPEGVELRESSVPAEQEGALYRLSLSGEIAPGGSAEVQVRLATPTAGSRVITARVDAAVVESDPGDNEQSVTLQVVAAAADLSVTAQFAAKSAALGKPLTLTAKVRSAGPDPASGATLTVKLPAGCRFKSADVPVAGTGKGTVTLDLSALAASGERTAAIQLVPKKAGKLVCRVTVAAAEADPSAANNQATVTVKVKAARKRSGK